GPKAFSRPRNRGKQVAGDTAGTKWAWPAPKKSALRQSSQASFSQLHPPSGWGTEPLFSQSLPFLPFFGPFLGFQRHDCQSRSSKCSRITFEYSSGEFTLSPQMGETSRLAILGIQEKIANRLVAAMFANCYIMNYKVA